MRVLFENFYERYVPLKIIATNYNKSTIRQLVWETI